MSSLTRAVTSRFSEFTHGRQRLTTEKEPLPPSTSEFNFFIPPEIIWEDYQLQKKDTPLKIEVDQTMLKIEPIIEKKTSPINFSQKMTAVVRKLSPFSDDSSTSSKNKDSSSTSEDGSSNKKTEAFKETKQKMERIKKSRKTKDRQMLIDSSDDEV